LYTTDVIERIVTSVDNVSIRMPENIGTNNSTGLELNAKYTPVKSLTITGDFNYNYFIRRGSFEDQSFDFDGQQWTAQVTTKFKLPADFDLELTGNYNSSVENIQGETAGFSFMDIGVRKKLWKGKAIVNFAIRDVFATRVREYTVEEPRFYQFSSSMRGTFYTLGVSFGFGKGEAMTYGGKGYH
jgi:outer membrane receptor for ferrienterochelin and colicin